MAPMAHRRLLAVTAVLVLLVVVVLAVLVAAFTAGPVAAVVASMVLALMVAVRSRLTGRPARWRARRAAPRGPGVWPAAVAAPPDPPGPTWTTTWETLPPPGEIPAVRGRVGAVLTEWGVDGDAAQPTLLVVTELLTNAVEHASAPIHLTLAWGHTFVRVQVHDDAPDAPQARTHDPMATRGRGLQVVEGLTLRRGWTPQQYGKTVWADVPTDWPNQRPMDGPPRPVDK
jgi:Histidine kinase-like ATPase domain